MFLPSDPTNAVSFTRLTSERVILGVWEGSSGAFPLILASTSQELEGSREVAREHG